RSASVRRALWIRHRASMGLARGQYQSSSLYSCRRAQTQRTPREPCRHRVDTHGTAESGVPYRIGKGLQERGRQCCGRNHGLLSLSLSSLTRREEAQSYTARESSTHKKTPARNGRGQPIQAAVPFPRKDVSALGRIGLLAHGSFLLSAPSQGEAPQGPLQISFRSQLRGSDGFAPSSLVTVSDCGQPYQRHIQFCRGAYGSTLGFAKDISEGIEAYLHDPSPIYMSSESRTR